jgi:hypothetical protein
MKVALLPAGPWEPPARWIPVLRPRSLRLASPAVSRRWVERWWLGWMRCRVFWSDLDLSVLGSGKEVVWDCLG